MPFKSSKPLKKRERRSSDAPLFITLEGGEGAGKSLLIDRLGAELQARGLAVLQTLNPGGSPLGERIRELVLHYKGDPPTPRAELLLYLADRAHHVQTVLLPALKRGVHVLCDRYNDSTLAYQAAGRGLNMEEVLSLCTFAAAGLTPDLTFYLDIDPEVGLQRVKKIGAGKDRLESEKIAFHRKVRAQYLKIAEQERERVVVIDASMTPDAVFAMALEELDARLPP